MKNLIIFLLVLLPATCIGQGTWNTRQDFDQGIQIVGGVTVSNVYISAGDTMITIAGKDFILSDIRLKLNIADTAAMLVPYINRSDTVAMLTPYALLSEANSAFNSGSGITIDGANNIDLDGALDASATISGTETNNISIDMVNTGSHSARFIFQAGDGFSLRGYDAANYTGDYGYLSVDNGALSLIQYDGAAEKGITMTSTSFVLRDDDGLVGMTAHADYKDAGKANARWIPDWGAVGDTAVNQLGGKTLDVTITNPGAGEDGDIVGWNNANSEWEAKDVVELPDVEDIMHVIDSTISFPNTDASIIVTLPEGAVVWDIQVYVATAFDGSGTDLLDVGITGTGEKFTDDLDLSVADVFHGLSNVAYRVSGTNIIFEYFDQNSDASAGLAYIYVHYSLHEI